MTDIKQISVFLENRKGALAAVCALLGNSGQNILAVSIAETDNFGICRLIMQDTEGAVKLLRANGYTVRVTDVTVVCVPDRAGGLADVLDIIEKEDISVEYMYSFIRNSGFSALLIFRFSDAARAVSALNAHYIDVLTQEQVTGA